MEIFSKIGKKKNACIDFRCATACARDPTTLTNLKELTLQKKHFLKFISSWKNNFYTANWLFGSAIDNNLKNTIIVF